METNAGTISFSGSINPGSQYSFETNAGTIDMALPAGTAFILDAKTNIGTVSNQFGTTYAGGSPSNVAFAYEYGDDQRKADVVDGRNSRLEGHRPSMRRLHAGQPPATRATAHRIPASRTTASHEGDRQPRGRPPATRATASHEGDRKGTPLLYTKPFHHEVIANRTPTPDHQ